eukprot:8811613-Alexandrium_andersonii.AAC.1
MRKLAECRDGVLAIRIQTQTGGAIRSRSQRFLAEVRAIERGESELSTWQALQREKQFQRNRVRRLDGTLKALQEGRAMPADEDQLWPGGTWECGTCGHRN